MKQHRFLSLLLAAAILIGGWSAWYSHPRTLEQLAPDFRWEEVTEVKLNHFDVIYPPTHPSGTDLRQFAIPQQPITFPPEVLAHWQDAAFQRKPLDNLRYWWGDIYSYAYNRRTPVYYRYYLTVYTNTGYLLIDVTHKLLVVEWRRQDGQSSAGPWVLTPPDGLLTDTGELFLPYAAQIENP